MYVRFRSRACGGERDFGQTDGGTLKKPIWHSEGLIGSNGRDASIPARRNGCVDELSPIPSWLRHHTTAQLFAPDSSAWPCLSLTSTSSSRQRQGSQWAIGSPSWRDRVPIIELCLTVDSLRVKVLLPDTSHPHTTQELMQRAREIRGLEAGAAKEILALDHLVRSILL